MDLMALAKQVAALSPEQRAELIHQMQSGFDAHLGMRFTHVDGSRVVATLDVTDHHLQPYGLVHGGVYCTLAEAVCSVGAVMSILSSGRHAVGAENRTRFKRAARAGTTLTATAVPAEVKEPWHTWQCTIEDATGRICAEGSVIVRALEPGTSLAGQRIEPPKVPGMDTEGD